ncbi:MAG: hypothetical protein IKD76_01045 [Clostridia bacterium]|nr:hypothetical protein [Clostridia bacterium]
MKVLKFSHTPAVGNHIDGYGDIEKVQRLGTESCASLAKVGDETFLIDSISLSALHKSPNEKDIFFATIKDIPRLGERYVMKRYRTYGLVLNWRPENVLSAPLIGIRKIWNNLYYAESQNSAYFLNISVG